jgi:choline kinase
VDGVRQRPIVGIVLAGGIGTRLFGPNGGSKALFDLDGVPLITYSIEALRQASITEIAIVVRETADEIFARVPNCNQILESGIGTLPAVRAAARYAIEKRADAVISSCDLVCPPSSATKLIQRSLSNPIWQASFGVTRIANDQSPIWVHSDGLDQILDYGKGIESSGKAFASIRFASLSFLKLMTNHLEEVSPAIDTDTKLMRHLILNKLAIAGAVDIGPALDVDDEVDARVANGLLRDSEFV